jgi:pilus assembly protein CpaF
LVREALRMRPDRIAVGEVRGAELGVMLQALNTGHSGAGATIHANSFGSVSERLTLIGKQIGLDADEVLAQARAAIHWVIFVHRNNSERRIQRIGRFGDE